MLLIYAAFNPAIRPPVLIYVGAGKLVFIALVLMQGGAFLRKQAGIAIIVDGVMVALFAAYLLATQG